MAIMIGNADITLPSNYIETQFKEAYKESVLGALSPNQTPMGIHGGVMSVFNTSAFDVGYVLEGGRKPVGDVPHSLVRVPSKKFAGIVPVSTEALRDDRLQAATAVFEAFRGAVQRQLDAAVLHGVAANTGNAIDAVTSVNQTTKRVDLDLASDLVPQLLEGYTQAGDEADPDGWAFDQTMRTRVAIAGQQQLAPAGGTQAMPSLANAFAGGFAGLNAAYNKSVSRRGTLDTLGFVGDWSSVKWGFSKEVEIRQSDQASAVGADGSTINSFQDNMTLFRVEFELAWYVDSNKFAAFDRVAP